MARLLAVLALAVSLSACDDGSGDEDDTDTDTMLTDTSPGDTTPGDTSPGDTTPDTVEPSSVRFVIENVGTDTLYIQQSLSAWSWVNVTNATGERLQLGWDCGPCECGETQGCPVCDIAPPTAWAVEGSDEWSTEWDGRAWSIDTVNNCSIVEPAPPGTYTATFCWGSTSRGDDTGFQSFVADIECESQTFELGTDTEVRQQASVTTPAPGASLTLENATASPIYYQAAADDCSGEPGWYTIADSGGTPLDLFADCGTCDCIYGPECIGGCDEACRAPQAPELAAGTSTSTPWDGLVAVTKTPTPGWTCVDYEPAPAGELSARMCWGTSRTGDDQSATIDNEMCDTTTFTLGVDTQVTVQAQ